MYLAERGPESRSQSSETEQKPDSQEPHLRKGRGGAGLSPDQVPTILSSWAPSMNTNKNGFCMRNSERPDFPASFVFILARVYIFTVFKFLH